MILRVLLLLGLAALCCSFSLSMDENIMTIARSKQEVAVAVHNATVHRELLLVYFTYELSKDGYAALYIGWLKHLFDSDRFHLRLLVVVTGKPRFKSITNFCLDIMPLESILVSFDHGLFVRRMREVGALKQFDAHGLSSNISSLGEEGGQYRSIANFGIFHLNHEQPWNFGKNYFHHDYSSADEVRRIYAAHGLGKWDDVFFFIIVLQSLS